jgi:hypothetical protein
MSMSPNQVSTSVRGIGVAVITSTSTPALGRQQQALMDAETVLLVDDSQRQVAEGDALLEQRVRADDDVDLAALKPARISLGAFAALSRGR